MRKIAIVLLIVYLLSGLVSLSLVGCTLGAPTVTNAAPTLESAKVPTENPTVTLELPAVEPKLVVWIEHAPFELAPEKHPECFVPVPEVDPSLNLTSGGAPLPDGFYQDVVEKYTGGTSDTQAQFIGRYMGQFKVEGGHTGISGSIVCVRIKNNIVPIFWDKVWRTDGVQIWSIPNHDVGSMGYDGLNYDQFIASFNSLQVGQQIVIGIPHDFSANDTRNAPLNPILKQIVDILKGQSQSSTYLTLPRPLVSVGLPVENIKK